MYVNKCIKCGREFETKNPKRVICPDCLYPDKKMMVLEPSEGAPSTSQEPARSSYSTENKPQFYSSYSSGGDDNQRPYNRPQRQYNNYNNFPACCRPYAQYARRPRLYPHPPGRLSSYICTPPEHAEKYSPD